MARITSALFAIVVLCASPALAQQPGWGTQPTQPTQPGWGTQPTQPTQPGWGTQPTQPTEPTQPAWGTQPTQPTQPTEPAGLAPTETYPETLPEGGGTAAPAGEFANIGLGFSNHFAPMFNTGSALTTVVTDGGVGAVPGDTAAAVTASYYANLSLRYRLNPSHEIEGILGMAYANFTHQDWDDPGLPGAPEEISLDGFMFHMGFRYLYTIAGNERARLYTGGGVGFLVGMAVGDEGDTDHPHGYQDWLTWGIHIGAPIGFEYRFEAAPQLALTMEVGLGLGYLGGSTTTYPDPTIGGPEMTNGGGVFIFGIGQAAHLGDPANPIDVIYIPIIDHVSFGLHYYF